jgi:hypothetical protein
MLKFFCREYFGSAKNLQVPMPKVLKIEEHCCFLSSLH